MNGTHFQFHAVLPPTGARSVESNTDTGSSLSSDFIGFETTHVETRILKRLGEDGTPDDIRYYLRVYMTANAKGVPTVDRTDSRIECK